MLPEALSKFIDELLEGKDPTISGILKEHPVPRAEFAGLVRAAVLAHGALGAIEVPADAEARSRERALKMMQAKPTVAPSAVSDETNEGLVERIRSLLQEKFCK